MALGAVAGMQGAVDRTLTFARERKPSAGRSPATRRSATSSSTSPRPSTPAAASRTTRCSASTPAEPGARGDDGQARHPACRVRRHGRARLQIHGGAGYMRVRDRAHGPGDARLGPIGGGTDEVMREILARPWASEWPAGVARLEPHPCVRPSPARPAPATLGVPPAAQDSIDGPRQTRARPRGDAMGVLDERWRSSPAAPAASASDGRAAERARREGRDQRPRRRRRPPDRRGDRRRHRGLRRRPDRPGAPPTNWSRRPSTRSAASTSSSTTPARWTRPCTR